MPPRRRNLSQKRHASYIMSHGAQKGHDMSETGLQKVAYFLLVALMLYVFFTGGGL